MGAGKNKSQHRKKRISKHVLQAEERKKQKEVENQLLSAAEKGKPTSSADIPTTDHQQSDKDKDTSATKSPSSSPKSSNTKDPEMASSYLTLWQYDKTNNTKQWKFNKNIQTFLLRNMYDFDKVNKTTFALLVDYICQGGDGLISRVEEDAKTKARRYKNWEKKQNAKNDNEEGEEPKEKDDDTNDDDKKEEQSPSDQDWNALVDHDKRKEYKRARKVLDTVKANREKDTES